VSYDDAIYVVGLDDAIKVITLDLRVAIFPALVGIAAEAQNRIAPYPEASHRPQPFKSAKQRRGFFARLRKGEIQVPYQRRGAAGGDLGSWHIVQSQGTGQVALVNDSPAAALLHSERKQARYHAQTGWKTDKGVADGIANDGTAGRMVDEAVQAAFNKADNDAGS
jgi:hypothetical protein